MNHPCADRLILHFRHVGALGHEPDASILHRIENERRLREADIHLFRHHLRQGRRVVSGRLGTRLTPKCRASASASMCELEPLVEMAMVLPSASFMWRIEESDRT